MDELTNNDYNHRRKWVVARLKLLVAHFAIDVGFQATLSNHLHLVLRSKPRLVKRMGSQEVARRWLSVYPGRRVLNEKWIEPTQEQIEQLAANKPRIKRLRRRLSSISWFMGALCEYVARRANKEDNTTGRFFEGRFGCRVVTDETALLVCGLYVDLNQVRAGEASTPEDSQHTSVGLRAAARRAALSGDSVRAEEIIEWMAPLSLADDHLGDMPSKSGRRASDKGLLPMSDDQYFMLLDWVGRQTRDKKAAIPSELANILDRLRINYEYLPGIVLDLPQRFPRLAGKAENLIACAHKIGQKTCHGIRAAAEAFG